MMKKHWYDYMWILSLTYLILGFFNIMFAWLGLLCFFIPLIIALVQGNKGYCNRIPQHLAEHNEEEHQKAVSKRPAFHPSRHSPVCLWILQRDADLYHIRTHYHGAV